MMSQENVTTSQQNARNLSPELVLVDFYEQQIEAILWQDDVWVSVKRICENLEIQPHRQRRKIKESPSFEERYADISIPSKGGNQKTFCIKLEAVTLWLASISPTKIRNPIKQDRIVRYQRECMQVLTRHFFSRKTAHQPTPPAQPEALTPAQLLLQQIKSQSEFNIKQAELALALEQRIHRGEQDRGKLWREQEKIWSEIKEIKETPAPKPMLALNPAPGLPAPQTIPLGRTMRSHLNERMRLVAIQTKAPFKEIWNKLYREFRDRTHTDLKQRAKNRGKTNLDMAEELNCISLLYDLCCFLWPNITPGSFQLPSAPSAPRQLEAPSKKARPAPPAPHQTAPSSSPNSKRGKEEAKKNRQELARKQYEERERKNEIEKEKQRKKVEGLAIVQIPSWALNKLLICQAKGGMKKEMADILWNASAMKLEGEELVDWPPSHQVIAGGISVKDYGTCYILEYGDEEYRLKTFSSNPE